MQGAETAMFMLYCALLSSMGLGLLVPRTLRGRGLLLLLPLHIPAGLEEVTTQQAVEEDDVHGCHDCHAHRAYSVRCRGHVLPIEEEPASHPGQRGDAEHHVGAQVDDAVEAVAGGVHQVGHEQDLPQVEEDGVNLHQ